MPKQGAGSAEIRTIAAEGSTSAGLGLVSIVMWELFYPLPASAKQVEERLGPTEEMAETDDNSYKDDETEILARIQNSVSMRSLQVQLKSAEAGLSIRMPQQGMPGMGSTPTPSYSGGTSSVTVKLNGQGFTDRGGCSAGCPSGGK